MAKVVNEIRLCEAVCLHLEGNSRQAIADKMNVTEAQVKSWQSLEIWATWEDLCREKIAYHKTDQLLNQPIQISNWHEEAIKAQLKENL